MGSHVEVRTPQGGQIRALGIRAADSTRTSSAGLYLDPAWRSDWVEGFVHWPAFFIDWPDGGVPNDARAAAQSILAAHKFAYGGDGLEIACIGGKGRTGTALACLAVLEGMDARSAIDWTRSLLGDSAVETPDQEAWVLQFSQMPHHDTGQAQPEPAPPARAVPAVVFEPAPWLLETVLTILESAGEARVPQKPRRPTESQAFWKAVAELRRCGTELSQSTPLLLAATAGITEGSGYLRRLKRATSRIQPGLLPYWEAITQSLGVALSELESEGSQLPTIDLGPLRRSWDSVESSGQQLFERLGLRPQVRTLRILVGHAAPMIGRATWPISADVAGGYVDLSTYSGRDVDQRVLESLLDVGLWSADRGSSTILVPTRAGTQQPDVSLAEATARSLCASRLVAAVSQEGHIPTDIGMGQHLHAPALYAHISSTIGGLLEGVVSRVEWSQELADWTTSTCSRFPGLPLVSTEYDLGMCAADFYALEAHVASTADARCQTMLLNLEAALIDYFVSFIDWAIGTEMGLVSVEPRADDGQAVYDFLCDLAVGDFGIAWARSRALLGTDALVLAKAAFANEKRSHGGNKWASITQVLLLRERGLLPDRVFIDTCFSLEHNHGIVFNRRHDVTGLTEVLALQAATDLVGLLGRASGATRTAILSHRQRTSTAVPVS